MRLLTVAFLSSAEFLSHYSESRPNGALFYRTRTELAEKEAVLIEISFAGLPNRVLIRGQVLSLEPGKGVWLAFNPADVSTRNFLLGLARGEIEVTNKVERSHSRFPVELPVAVKVKQNDEQATEARSEPSVRQTQTVDVSMSGVFIRSQSPPPVGAHVQLMIGPTPDGPNQQFTLEGEVAWVRKKDGEKGFGVHFKHRGEDNRRLRTLLRRASESGRVRFATG